MRRLLFVALAVMLAACGAPQPTPRPTSTAWLSPLFLPAAMVGHRVPGTSAKKGVVLGHAPCSELGDLGVTWYTGDSVCPGFEHVVYLDGHAKVTQDNVVALAPGPIMFLNEPDLGYWNMPSLEQLVEKSIAALHGQDIAAAGPCVSHDLGYIERFWLEYRDVSGDVTARPAAICFHCYDVAVNCVKRTQEAIEVADRLGVAEIWLTEFGLPPGLGRSFSDVVAENQALVEYLENEPRVGRYAYFAVGIRYGDGVPSDPLTGWWPLAYEWHNWGGGIEWRLTPMGEAFSRWP